MRQRPRRALGYARVSSAEQAIGTSLQDQQDAIRAYARAKGLEVARMYVEAESAVHEKIERREQIRALLSEVGAGDLVLVDKLDRWSRDPEFTYKSVRELLAKGAGFYAVGDQCDPSTPEGDTMLGFRILFAREEHKRIKQRMVGTRKILRDRGYYVEGLPPWGYARRAVKGAEKNALIVDDVEAKRVRRAFRLCIEGRSIQEIATTIDEHRDRVHEALHNRAYLGEIEDSRGEWIKARHEPIIDARTFEAARLALAGRRYGSRSPGEGVETADWWLRDVAYCLLCGSKMSAAYAGVKGARRYYLMCRKRCVRKWVPVRDAEEKCEPLVLAHLDTMREQLATSPKRAARSGPTDEDLGERRARVQRKRERYLEAFADGHLDRDGLREKMAQLDVERTKIDALAVRIPEATPARRREVLVTLNKIARAWKKASPAVRRQIVNHLARRVLLARGEAPRPDWRPVEEMLEEVDP